MILNVSISYARITGIRFKGIFSATITCSTPFDFVTREIGCKNTQFLLNARKKEKKKDGNSSFCPAVVLLYHRRGRAYPFTRSK